VKAECVADAVGICTVALRGDATEVVELVEDLRPRLAASGGAVVVLQEPHGAAEIDRWGGEPPAIALMREVKRQFDPARMLNPGRFVGGI
jgi:glycolate oxidase FAD binding subunit